MPNPVRKSAHVVDSLHASGDSSKVNRASAARFPEDPIFQNIIFRGTTIKGPALKYGRPTAGRPPPSLMALCAVSLRVEGRKARLESVECPLSRLAHVTCHAYVRIGWIGSKCYIVITVTSMARGAIALTNTTEWSEGHRKWR